jgi:hypothetical protein
VLNGRTEVAEFYAANLSVAIRDCAVGTLPGLERGVVLLESGDWEAWLHGTAAQADALVKLPPLGVLRSGAEKPEEGAQLPAEQLQALRSETGRTTEPP